MKFHALRFGAMAILACAAFAGATVLNGGVARADDAAEESVPDDYISLSFENLSKMYWVVGMLSLENNEAIDNYMRINECDLYQKYIHNDFEWRDIRAAAADHIRTNIMGRQQKFEIIMPIYLGRYDLGTEKFEILPDSRFINMTRLETEYNKENLRVCETIQAIPGYPKNIMLQISTPLNLVEVPVKREVAELYMEEALRKFSDLAPEARLRRYERAAYVRFKVTLLQYKEAVNTGSGALKAGIFGRIDGFEIYADQAGKLLMYAEDIDHSRSVQRRRVRRTDTATQPANDAAAQENATTVEQTPSEVEDGSTDAVSSEPAAE